MSFPCSFCGSVLSTKSNLATHQKKTIKCLEKQHALNTSDNVEDEKRFECTYCKYRCTQKANHARHEEACKNKDLYIRFRDLQVSFEVMKKELELTKEQSKEQIESLREQLAKKEQNQQIVTLAAVSKPSSTTSVKNTIKNCTIQNLTPLVEDEMRGHLDNFTIDHVKAGPAGYAKYAMEYPLKNKITCTDSSRRKLAWKDSEGVVVYDADGARLSEKFFRVLREKNQRFFREIILSLGEQLDEAYSRGDQVEADTIVELTDKICTWRREATETSRGQDTELRKDFVKYLCTSGPPRVES